MKQVKYTVLRAVGNGGTHEQGDLKSFLLDIPYLFFRGSRSVLPTLPVLNDLLEKGLFDAGMSGGCRWNPFQISREEYEELVEELLTDPEFEFVSVETPSRITTFESWALWRIKFIRNV